MNIAYKIFLNKIHNCLKETFKIKKSNIRILDLGCGDFLNNPILKCGFKDFDEYVGVDAFRFDNNIKNTDPKVSFVNKNLFEVIETFDEKSFDIVLALDLIEHLTIEDGEKLLLFMKNLSKYNIIVFTPNGFVKQEDPINKYNCHLSGWSFDYFQSKGYKSYPMYGFKIFRKEFCELRSPKLIFGPLSLFSNLVITRFFPKLDLALLHKLNLN